MPDWSLAGHCVRGVSLSDLDGEPTMTPAPIAIGARVIITAGMAHGVQGVVLERWPRDIGKIAQWVVGSSDLVRKRVVRADFLRVLP